MVIFLKILLQFLFLIHWPAGMEPDAVADQSNIYE